MAVKTEIVMFQEDKCRNKKNLDEDGKEISNYQGSR